jgi:predicted enzyme related to lactoylglutathione lyase
VNFNSILIGSDNADRLIEYYTKLLGKPISDGGYATFVLGTGGVSIGPHSEVHGRNTSPGRLIWNIESQDVPGDAQRFKAAGATVVKDAYEFDGAPGMWIATFSDPDDNYFQLVSPFDPSQMGS